MRTFLVGMNNPLSADPAFALFPHPPGCTGHRLYRMLHDHCGCSRSEYIRGFERVNVLESTDWSAAQARARREALRARLAGRRAVVLGAAPLVALGLRPAPVGRWTVLDDGLEYTCLAHPSGRCREYNSPDYRVAAGRLLAEEFRRGQSEESETCTSLT